MAHVKQSRPDSGHGFQVKVLKIFQVVPSSLGIGPSVQPGLSIGVRDHGFGLWDLGFRVPGSGFLVSSFGFQGFRFLTDGFGFARESGGQGFFSFFITVEPKVE